MEKNWNIGTLIEFFKKQGNGVELIKSDETEQAFFSNDFIDYVLYQNDFDIWYLKCENVEIRNYNIFNVPLPKSEKKLIELLTLLEEAYQ